MSKDLVQEKVKSAGLDGKEAIVLGGAVNRDLNKTFAQGGVVAGNTEVCVAIDQHLKTLEIARYTMNANGELERPVEDIIEQIVNKTHIENPTEPVALSEHARVYLSITHDEAVAEIQSYRDVAEQASQAATAHAGTAEQKALEATDSAGVAAQQAGNASDAAAAAGTSAGQAAGFKDDAEISAIGAEQAKVEADTIVEALENDDQDMQNVSVLSLRRRALEKLLSDDPNFVAMCFENDTQPDWLERLQGKSYYDTHGPMPRNRAYVAYTTRIDIIDLTKSHTPVWMSFDINFDGNSSRMAGYIPPTSIVAINNRLYIGHSPGNSNNHFCALTMIDFLADTAFQYTNAGSEYPLGSCGPWTGTIADRNDTITNHYPGGPSTLPTLVDDNVNAVSAITLPSATRDEYGMLVPTVVAANDGGLSLIGVPGATGIVHITTNVVSDERSLSASIHNGKLFFNMTRAGDGANAVIGVSDIPTTSTVFENLPNLRQFKSDYGNIGSADLEIFEGEPAYERMSNVLVPTEDGFICDRHGSGGGKGFIKVRLDADGNETFQAVSTTVATPEITVDTIACLMADTEVGTVGGVEYINNGDFALDESGNWISAANVVNISMAAGALRYEADGTGGAVIRSLQNNSVVDDLVAGQSYGLVVDFAQVAGVGGLTFFASVFDSNVSAIGRSENFVTTTGQSQQVSLTFTATNNNHVLIYFYTTGTNPDAGDAFEITNLSLCDAITDHSGKGNHARVVGSLTKTPVATGAELAAVSGLSGTDYMTIPHSNDLPEGVENLSIAISVRPSAIKGSGIIDFGDVAAGKRRLLYMNSLGQIAWNNFSNQISTPNSLSLSEWQRLTVTQSSAGPVNVAVNGVVVASGTMPPLDQTNVNDLLIGVFRSGVNLLSFDGELADLKIESAEWSEEEIARDFQHARNRWQPNTKITIQGNSDLVNAVAENDTHRFYGTDGGGVTAFHISNDTVARHITAANSELTSDTILSISAEGDQLAITDADGRTHYERAEASLDTDFLTTKHGQALALLINRVVIDDNGDISFGTPLRNFRSTGISDTATSEQIELTDDALITQVPVAGPGGTFANRPLISAGKGQHLYYFATDIGTNGTLIVSNGDDWINTQTGAIQS